MDRQRIDSSECINVMYELSPWGVCLRPPTVSVCKRKC